MNRPGAAAQSAKWIERLILSRKMVAIRGGAPMRLVSFEADGTPLAGIRLGDEVAALGDPATGMQGLLAAGTRAIEAMAAKAPRRKLSSVTLLPPVPTTSAS
jgi:hypothetical protein